MWHNGYPERRHKRKGGAVGGKSGSEKNRQGFSSNAIDIPVGFGKWPTGISCEAKPQRRYLFTYARYIIATGICLLYGSATDCRQAGKMDGSAGIARRLRAEFMQAGLEHRKEPVILGAAPCVHGSSPAPHPL